MNRRTEVFSHTEKLWVLCLGQESLRAPLPPLIDMVDWYNNQLLTKSLLKNHIKIDFTSQTLLSSVGQLPVNRLVVFGLGEEKNLSESQAKLFLTGLNSCLEGLDVKAPWIIISPYAAGGFINEIKKGHSRHSQLVNSTISME